MNLQSNRCYQDVCPRRCFGLQIIWVATAVVVLLAVTGPKATAQRSSSLPQNDYYTGLGFYYQDRLKTAETAFKRASSGYITGSQQGQRLWVDAVCSFTMRGECYYKAGNLDEARKQYRNALDVLMANPGWMNRVTFPATLQKNENAIARARINWGTTSRQGAVAQVPKMTVLFGDRDIQNKLQNGGVVREPENRIVDVVEIVRCAALAMARRREIFGPLSKHAPYSRTLVMATQPPPLVNHPYAAAWSQLLHGLSLASNAEYSKAIPIIQGAAQAKGYDHPLTPIALFELANIHYEQGEIATAAKLYLETTFSAAIFSQWDIFSQAFERGFQAHLLSGNKSEYLPLSLVLQSDLYRKLPDSVQCNLLLMGSEAQIERGNLSDAMAFLNKAKKMLGRDTAKSSLAARFYFHLAQANALNADVSNSMNNARTAFQIYQSSSKKLFQIGASLQLDINGSITQRTAGVIYDELLNEPTNMEWIASPMESFTFLLSPIQTARARWFQIAMNRKEYEKAMEIADNIRRFQFYNSMPLGGRLLAFRWMLEAPESMVSPETVQQRKIFHLAYPNYLALSEQGAELEQKLREIDGLADLSTDEGKSQVALNQQLSKNSMTREIMLINAAFKRNAAPMSFPPRLDFGELQKRLGPKQAAWIFFAAGKSMYSFFMTKDSYKLEKTISITDIQRQLPSLLKKMGNTGVRNAPITQKILEENGWRKHAQELMAVLQPKGIQWDSYDELVIVPDNILWYLPFDVLQPDATNDELLGDKVAIRYAPTVSTIVPDGRKVKPSGKTLVVAGRMTRNQDKDVNETEIKKLQESVPNAAILNRRIGFDSATFSSQIDTLLIWDEIEGAEKLNGFEWAPLQVDQDKPRSTVGDWMSLPFSGPEQYIVPGFHTVAGSGRIRGDGSEIFRTVCGMMASGARTVLISRWAVGGENDFSLTRNFLIELRNDSAAKAWQRARALAKLNDINPDREPRVRSLSGDVPLKTDHPFFWSGYLLIDTGAQPAKDQ